jgi:hypothetical protein
MTRTRSLIALAAVAGVLALSGCAATDDAPVPAGVSVPAVPGQPAPGPVQPPAAAPVDDDLDDDLDDRDDDLDDRDDDRDD